MIAARQPYRVVFPVLLILAGAVLLLANLGTLPEEAGWRLLQLWPLLLVMIGVQILVPHLVRGAAVPALTLLIIGLLAVGGFAFALAGPSLGSTSYERFQSTSPVAGQTEATIRIDDAADQITITARDIGTQLYQAKVDHVGSAPQFSYANGEVEITRKSNVFNYWGRGRDVVEVLVNPSVAWNIVIDGAGTTTRIDLSNGNLQSFKLNGAGSNVTITAGNPRGIVQASFNGVGLGVTLRVPATAEYRVITEGLGTSIDGVPQTNGWSSAGDRFDVTVNGVGTHATVTTTG
jgi:hypothetical protein